MGVRMVSKGKFPGVRAAYLHSIHSIESRQNALRYCRVETASNSRVRTMESELTFVTECQ